MKRLLLAFVMLGMLVGTTVAQDIPPVKELQIIPSWENSESCIQANEEWKAGKVVHLRYADSKKKKVELEVPAERIHKAATETVRTALIKQSQWAWRPNC